MERFTAHFKNTLKQQYKFLNAYFKTGRVVSVIESFRNIFKLSFLTTSIYINFCIPEAVTPRVGSYKENNMFDNDLDNNGLSCLYDDVCEGEDYLYDTYDQIVDNLEDLDDNLNDVSEERDFGNSFDMPDSIEMGLALALAEEICESKKQYNVDKDTDRENWNKIMQLVPLHNGRAETHLRPFEQYIDDICKSRKPLFQR